MQQHEPLNGVGPRPRIWDAPNGHIMCELNPSVPFPCQVNGQEMRAFLTHAEDDLKQWFYHIRFADGHKAVFQLDRKQKCWVERGQKAPSAYAKAVNDDLLLINEFNPYHPPFCLIVKVKGEEVKVWATCQKEGAWYVFHDGGLKFFVHPWTGEWQVETFEHPESFAVPEIAEAVTTKLQQTFKLVVLNSPENQAPFN